MTTHLTGAQAERLADRRVMFALAKDREYLSAMNAQQQAEREDEIAAEVWADIEHEYNIA